MILLDTHIWLWWVDQGSSLSPAKSQAIKTHEADGLGVSVICCWEVAKLVEKKRLALSVPVDQWVQGPWRPMMRRCSPTLTPNCFGRAERCSILTASNTRIPSKG